MKTKKVVKKKSPKKIAAKPELCFDCGVKIGKCFNCSIKLNDLYYCYGCEHFVCTDCDATMACGKHDPEEHLES